MPLQQFSHLSPSPSPQLLPIISLLITAKQDIRKWIVLPKAYQLGNTTTATLYRSKSATLYSTREKSLPSTVEKKKLQGEKSQVTVKRSVVPLALVSLKKFAGSNSLNFLSHPGVTICFHLHPDLSKV